MSMYIIKDGKQIEVEFDRYRSWIKCSHCGEVRKRFVNFDLDLSDSKVCHACKEPAAFVSFVGCRVSEVIRSKHHLFFKKVEKKVIGIHVYGNRDEEICFIENLAKLQV